MLSASSSRKAGETQRLHNLIPIIARLPPRHSVATAAFDATRRVPMNLLKAASTVSLLTLASRISGLAREQLIAASFGASAWTDAYNVAFRIPNLLRRLFAEGAFSQAFVPVLAEYKNRQSHEETKTLVDGVATALFLALVLAALIGVILSPLIVYLSAPGFT